MQPEIPRSAAIDALSIEKPHPRVFHDPDELARARRNVATTEWGQSLLEAVLDTVEEWPFVDLTGPELRELAPVPDREGRLFVGFPFRKFGTFSSGNLCPIDGSYLGLAGFDRPGHVECDHGHVFPGEHDGVTVTDDGAGWELPDSLPEHWAVAQVDQDLSGTPFWFVAYYNGYIIKHIEQAFEPLAYAAALTEEDRYAETVAELFAVIADAHRQHHLLVGRRDPNANSRLIRPGYQVARALKDYANAADLVWNHPAMAAESAVRPGATVRERVAEDLVVDAADFIWQTMDNYTHIFHNGTGDYNEGLLAAASLLDLDVGYAEWALDGQVSLDYFLTNTVFRDGQYYETAEMYSVDFFEWAELARHLRSDTYPDGMDVFEDDRFIDLNANGPERFALAGRLPQYGDTAWPDLAVQTGPYDGHVDNLLRFYAHANDESARTAYANRIARLTDGDLRTRLANRSVSGSNPNEDLWPLFLLDDEVPAIEAAAPTEAASSRDSELLGAKGFAMLRPDQGHDRGAMLRYGPTLSHGHCDELGLHAYGAGRDLTLDPGHKPKRHFMNSFQRQTVAHQTVVVNETSQVPPEDPGGRVEFFGTGPGLTAVEISNPVAYAHEDIDEYRRTTAFMDVGSDQSYLFDIFRVAGPGLETADYSFHGQGTDFQTDLLFDDPAPGSVASPEYDWGRCQRESGEIAGFEDEPFGFNAPPENGYGFLGHPRNAAGSDAWSATWRVQREDPPAALRLTMLGGDQRTVIGADAPDLILERLGLDPEEYTLPYLLARERGDPAQFVSVIEPGADELPVSEVTELSVESAGSSGFDPVAAAVSLDTGGTDYFVATLGDGSVTVSGSFGRIDTDASLGVVRQHPDGSLSAHLQQGAFLEGQIDGESVRIEAASDTTEAEITTIDREDGRATVNATLSSTDAIVGEYVFVDRATYARNSAYRVLDATETTHGETILELERCGSPVATGIVEATEPDSLLSAADLPMAWTRSYYVEGEGGNEYLTGKRIVGSDSGAATTVTDVSEDYRRIGVQDATDFEAGEEFRIWDLQDGDVIHFPTPGRSVGSVPE